MNKNQHGDKDGTQHGDRCGCHRGLEDLQSDPRWKEMEMMVGEYKERPGALIPVLHKVQNLFGYLPREVQIAVAEGLGLPLSEVYGVATFYSLFSLKPRGRYNIGVCLGTACYVKGAPEILATLKERLQVEPGETTEDGLFSLQVTRCIGACGLAPAMAVGEDVYGRLKPEMIPEILARYRALAEGGGEGNARTVVAHPGYCPELAGGGGASGEDLR